MKERLLAVKDLFDQIHNSGREMDGNTSNNEEDEFIDALTDEMPDVYGNII